MSNMNGVTVYKTERNYDYKGTEVAVIKSEYHEEGTGAALILVKADNFEEIVLVASVNLGIPSPLDKTFIKDYSENSGVKQWLIEQGIIYGDVLRERQSGFVTFTEHLINVDVFEAYDTIVD